MDQARTNIHPTGVRNITVHEFTPRYEGAFEGLEITKWKQTSLAFMKPGFQHCVNTDPFTALYPEAVESRPYLQALLFWDAFQHYSMPKSSKYTLTVRVLQQILQTFVNLPICLHTIFPHSTNNKPINMVVTLT